MFVFTCNSRHLIVTPFHLAGGAGGSSATAVGALHLAGGAGGSYAMYMIDL